MNSFEPVVDAAVWSRFPDYRALSVVIQGFRPERPIETPLAAPPAWFDAHAAAWHEAFKAFGSNPKRTAPSFDALVRRYRKDGGLPAIHPLVDCYNALSVQYGAPFGGEDIDKYSGSPRLVVADGSEPFDTSKDGQPVIEHPDAGEVVWRDDAGVTCRRWNWRQARRTQLREDTSCALFIFDALNPISDDALNDAADDLVSQLEQIGRGLRIARRLLVADATPAEGA